MQGRLFLDVIVRESSSIFQLLSSKNQPLLVRGDSFLVLDLCFNILNGIRRFNFESDGLASQGFHKDLHTSSQSEDKVEGGLLLNVVIGKSSSIFKLFSGKDQPLLVWGDSFLVLDLGFDIFDGIRGLNFKSDGLSSECLDKDLHSSSQPEDKMECGLLLDVVVRQSSSIFKLLSSKDQSLLVWGDSFLVLDLSLDIFDGVGGLNFKSDSFASECLDKDLHSSSETEHKMKSAFLLDIIVGESSSVLQLLSSKDEPLLVRWDSLFVLNLSLDVLNGIRGLNLKGDSFPCKGLDENLHFLCLFPP